MVLRTTEICCEHLQSMLNNSKYPVAVIEDGTGSSFFGVKYRVYGVGYCYFFFCPWCGREFPYSREWNAKFLIASDLLSKSEVDSKEKMEKWWSYDKNEALKRHGINNDWKEFIEEDFPFVYRSNIRTFGILKLKKFSPNETLKSIPILKERTDFTPVNYCHVCGTKFPKRLDNKLTEILQNEYGLSSWRDYKKAPKEFHSDEWWKKRGL